MLLRGLLGIIREKMDDSIYTFWEKSIYSEEVSKQLA